MAATAGRAREWAMAGRPRVLIVDDEPFNVDLLKQELELLGYATVVAADGRQAGFTHEPGWR